jgi:predicted amidohydrolase
MDFGGKMSRTIKVAAIQMDASLAPTLARLARADRLVRAAAQAGAQLMVLPEIFNTGYGYTEENYNRAEPLHGPTSTWLKETAARHNIHLAGSLMLLDGDEVYNALLLFAPDGRLWRYDKTYPWGWERGYFRGGRGPTIARTDLGDLGLLICWDIAHPKLWRRYAGRVEMMVIASCPPDVTNPIYHFPNGDQFTLDDLGPVAASLKGTGSLVFGDMLSQQTAWLGVPAVNTTGSGQLRTDIPNGFASVLMLLPTAPWLAKYLPQAGRLQLSSDFIQGCKVVDANGQVLSELTQGQGETFTMAEVTLAGQIPSPRGSQPKSPLPWESYFLSDTLLPALMTLVYRRGLRQAWGQHMAPVKADSRRTMLVAGLAALGIGVLIGVFLRRNRI